VARLLTPQQMERANTLVAADAPHPQNPTAAGGDGDVSLIQEP